MKKKKWAEIGGRAEVPHAATRVCQGDGTDSRRRCKGSDMCLDRSRRQREDTVNQLASAGSHWNSNLDWNTTDYQIKSSLNELFDWKSRRKTAFSDGKMRRGATLKSIRVRRRRSSVILFNLWTTFTFESYTSTMINNNNK